MSTQQQQPTDNPPALDFMVPGIPAPGGSKTVMFLWNKDGTVRTKYSANTGKHIPLYNVIDDAGKGNKEWRKAVAWKAKEAWQNAFPGVSPTDRPVMIMVNFWLPRPQYEIRANGALKDSARKYHTIAPDALKLMRSTEDALTKVLWEDDAQVISESITKQLCNPGEKPGARIRLWIL